MTPPITNLVSVLASTLPRSDPCLREEGSFLRVFGPVGGAAGRGALHVYGPAYRVAAIVRV